MARQGDVEAENELYNGPQLPPLAAYLWSWWIELSTTRTSSGFGPNPITRHDIHAWEADTHHSLRAWERQAILRMDALWLASVRTDEPQETT